MAIYETVVILDSLLPPKEIDDIVEHFSKVITEHGGKVRTVDKWGKRRLAYEIQKKQYGFYFAIEFEGIGNIAAELYIAHRGRTFYSSFFRLCSEPIRNFRFRKLG